MKIIAKRLDTSLQDRGLPMESVVGNFIEQMMHGRKPKIKLGKSRYEVLTTKQLEEYTGRKIRLSETARLVQALERENPGSANSFYNAIKKYKNA